MQAVEDALARQERIALYAEILWIGRGPGAGLKPTPAAASEMWGQVIIQIGPSQPALLVSEHAVSGNGVWRENRAVRDVIFGTVARMMS